MKRRARLLAFLLGATLIICLGVAVHFLFHLGLWVSIGLSAAGILVNGFIAEVEDNSPGGFNNPQPMKIPKPKGFITGALSTPMLFGGYFLFFAFVGGGLVAIGQWLHVAFLETVGGIAVVVCVVGGFFSMGAELNRGLSQIFKRR